MSRFMALLFIGSIVANAHAAEYIALQRAYQAAKDPATRARLMQRMQAAQANLQQRAVAGISTAEEAIQRSATMAMQRARNFKTWVMNNQGKVLAAAVALGAVAIAAGAVALEAEDRTSILQVFRNNGVDVSNPATARYAIETGQLIRTNYNKLWNKIEKMPAEEADIFIGYMQTPGFKESLRQIAGYQNLRAIDTLEQIVPTSVKRAAAEKWATTALETIERMRRGEGVSMEEYKGTFGY